MSNTGLREVSFDDIDGLKAQISDEFGETSDQLLVTQDMIDQYAELTGDNQWIHVDVARAEQESPYHATIAQGFLLLGLMPKLRPPSAFSVVNQKGVLNYGSRGLRFLAPVIAGATIQSRQRLIAVELHRRGTLLTSEVIFERASDNQAALSYAMQLLYF